MQAAVEYIKNCVSQHPLPRELDVQAAVSSIYRQLDGRASLPSAAPPPWQPHIEHMEIAIEGWARSIHDWMHNCEGLDGAIELFDYLLNDMKRLLALLSPPASAPAPPEEPKA